MLRRYPSGTYTNQGGKKPPLKGKAFLVFLTEDGKVFQWRWEDADPNREGYPENWQERFGGSKMAKDLMKHLETAKPRGFEPRPYYGPEEDSLTFYFDTAESYGKRVDELLTLFLSVSTDELVGCQVKGIRKNLQRLGHFGIAIKHGKVRLDLVFHLLAFLAEKPQQRQKYLDLSQRTKDAEIEFDDELVGT